MKYIIYPFIYFISLFPFPIVYIFSWIIYIIVKYIVKYRADIILQNLKHAFPEKTIEELKDIRSQFYRNYSEIIIETIKILLISKKQVQRMIELDESSDLEKLFNGKKGAVILTGHLGNFELAGQLFGIKLDLPVIPAYKPIKNKVIEDILYQIRTRFGTHYTPVKNILKKLLENIKSGVIIIFLNDQYPTAGNVHTIHNFLNRETRFFHAPEKFARKYDLPVYFFDMTRVKRGKYILTAELITVNPKEEKETVITEMYVNKLENAIRNNPSGWLWSHKRWKNEKNPSN